MKRNCFPLLLAAAALGGTLLSVFSAWGSAAVSSLLAFPFEQLALGLSALAGLGAVGNGAALALLALAGLLVLLPALGKGAAGRLERLLNVLTALGTVAAVWLMAHPRTLLGLNPLFGEMALPVLKGMLGVSVWALAVSWAAARLLRLFRAGDMERLTGYLGAMLRVLCLCFVAAAALTCPGELAKGWRECAGAADYVLTLLRFAVGVLPYALDTAVVLAMLRVLDLRPAEESGELEAAAERLSRLCCASLLAVCLSTAGLDLLQLLLMPSLSRVDVTVSIPVVSLAFVLAVLLLARLLVENRRLADDNDLFI